MLLLNDGWTSFANSNPFQVVELSALQRHMADFLVHLTPEERALLSGMKTTQKVIAPHSVDWLHRSIPVGACSYSWKVLAKNAINFMKTNLDCLFTGFDAEYVQYASEGMPNNFGVRVVYDVGHLKVEVINNSDFPVTASLVTVSNISLT